MTRAVQEQEIRELAYALWQEAGSPEGRKDEFWTQAEEILTSKMEPTDIDKASEESFPASDAVNHM
jgi:hypothetical protein